MIESVSEYKFFARTCTYKQVALSIILLALLFISSLILFFYADKGNLYTTLFVVVSLLALIFFNVFISKYVKIVADENFISIYYWGKLKFRASVQQLIEIQGVDVDKDFNQAELHFIFYNKSFVFILWESSLARANKQTRILRDIVAKYQLEKEFFKKNFPSIDIYKYKNIIYEPLENDSCQE